MKSIVLSSPPFRALALAVASAGALMSSAYATTYTWTEAGTVGVNYSGGNWSAASKWNNGTPSNDGTADLVFSLSHNGWPNYTVNPASLTPSTHNWSIDGITFINSGNSADWGAPYIYGPGGYNSTADSLSIGASGITNNQLSSPEIGVPIIATASQAWNINNMAGNFTGGLTIKGNLTLNNGVTISKNVATTGPSTAPTAWFSGGGWYLPTVVGFYNGSTTTVGTGAFALTGGGFLFSGVSQYGRLGSNPLAITMNPSYRLDTSLSFQDTTSGTFANNVVTTAGYGSVVGITYGNGSTDAGTTLTLTGTWSGDLRGGETNDRGMINVQTINYGAISDDRNKLIIQGNNSSLISDNPTNWGLGILHIPQSAVVLDNANALGTGNSLSIFLGNNANSTTNNFAGLLATSGHDVSAHIWVRGVDNGSNQHRTSSEIGLSGTGSVTYSGDIQMDTTSWTMGQGPNGEGPNLGRLKLTAPAGGQVNFTGHFIDSYGGDPYLTTLTVLAGGTVKIAGSNAYKGQTIVRGGTLLVGGYDNALGNGTGATNVSLGGTVIAPSGGDVVAATTSELAAGQWWTINDTAGTLTFPGAVTSIDGVALSAGNRILYKDAQAPERTGVYTYVDSTHWTRSADLNTASAFVAGLRIHVLYGTRNGGKNFYLPTGLWNNAVLEDNSGNSTSAMFVFNPDADSTANVAILTDDARNISRNIDVTNNLSTGKSILGGNSAVSSTFSGTVALSKDLTVTSASSGTVAFSGAINGSNNLIKEGPGTVIFSTPKAYTGTTNVTAGTLEVDNTLASSAVSISSGGTLQGIGSITNAVSVSGTLSPGNSGIGTLTVGSASFASGSTYAATISGYSTNQLVSNGTLNLNGAALSVTLTGIGWAEPSYVIAQGSPLIGTFSTAPSGYEVTYTSTQARLILVNAYYYVTPTGNDTNNTGLSLGGSFATIPHAASYLQAGDTCLIASGTYSGAITVPQPIPTNSRIAFQNNANEAVNISGAVTLNTTLTLSSSSGATFNITGDITGSYGIIKEAPGNAVFTGNKSYTGTTSVTGGTLTINGSVASSAVTVSSGATLAGTGSITNGVTVSGVVNPGITGIGTLTVGSASFSSSGNLTVGINGSSNGLLEATGALNLTGASLTVTPTGSGWTQTSYVIAQGSPLTGTFTSVPDGYAVSYSSTQVTLTSVPAYYVSPGGSDANNGQSVNAPFATISHAVSVMGTAITTAQTNHTTPFSTSCFIRAGTYRETVTVPFSGTATAPITFKAYNNEAVTISGTDPIPGWVLESPNVYKATTMPTGWTSLGTGNQVFQNGVMLPEAGWPKKDNTNGTLYPWRNSTLQHLAPYSALGDWSYVDSASYTTVASFVDAQLPPRSNGYWNGAKLHIMAGYGWGMACNNVTGYTESTKTIVTDNSTVEPGGAYTIMPGNEYYLTGIKGEMSTPGEWFFDTNTGMLDVWSTAPPVGVEVKSRKYGFNILGDSYINLVNLSFFGCTIQTFQNYPQAVAKNCILNGLSLKYLAHDSSGNADTGLYLGPGCVLRNSELAYTPLSMVGMYGSDIRVINNNIHHSGYIPGGMPAVYAWGWDSYIPYRNLVSHNTIHTTGYSGIGGVGMSGIIEYNNIYDAMTLASDGGLIYSNGYAGNTVVRYNLLHDSTGPAGHGGNGVEGFYVDCQNSDWIVHHNIIWNLPTAAFQFNARTNFNMVFNNTCWNTGGAMNSAFWGDGPSGDKFYNNLFGNTPSSLADPAANPDMRFNLNSDPSFVNPSNGNFQLQSSSPAIDAGTVVPGVTDGYLGSAPDLGALEYGATDWTSSVGYNPIPPSPDPVYSPSALIFSDHVVDGSFESGTLNNWTIASGSNCGLTASSAWYDVQQRTGYFAVQFGGGTSEISQIVTGLQPDTRYTFFCGAQKTDTTAVVNFGVRNYGYPTVQSSVSTTGIWQESSYDPVARMHSLTFITGPTNTNATIYVDVTRAANSPVAPKASNGTFPTVAATSVYLGNDNTSDRVDQDYPSTGVYLDDLCVQQTNLTADTIEGSPLVHYTLNETSGLTAHDSSVYSRDGAVNSSSPLWQAGMIGNSLGFNGTGDYLVTPAITTPTSLTVACWAKAPVNASPSNNSTWNAYGCFVSKRPSFVLHPWLGSKNLSFLVYSGATGLPATLTWTPASSFDITTWHHYAGVFSPNTQQILIYVDGALVASQSASFSINPDTWTSSNGELVANVGKIYIGRDDYWLDGNRNFNGVLDDVRVYDRALSAQQIQALVSEDPSEMLHLTFDESAGATRAWDSSLYAAPGTLVNMATSTAWVAGKINGALHFDGVDDYVQTSPMTTPADLTLECWAKSDLPVWGNNGGSFIAATPAFLLNPIAGSRDLQFTVNTATTPTTLVWASPSGFEVNVWHHYAAVYSSAAQIMSIYVDGAQVASNAGPSSLVQTTCPVTIGADDSWTQTYISGNPSSGRHFLGTLDDVQVYSRALSWNELLETSHQTFLEPFTLTTNLSSDYMQDGLPNAWKLQYGLSPYIAYSATDSSLSHDGIGLLMKYASGQNPLADSSATLPKISNEVDSTDHLTYLTFKYLRRTDYPHLTYTVEVSNDLQSWNSGSAYTSELGTTPTGDGVTELVTVRVLPAIDGSQPLRVARLHLTSP